MNFTPLFRFFLHFTVWCLCLWANLNKSKKYSGVVVTDTWDESRFVLNLIEVVDFVTRLRLFHREDFLLFIQLFEGLDYIVSSGSRDFIELLMLNNLVDVCHFIRMVALDLLLFGPFHFYLIATRPGAILMEPRIIIKIVSSFGLVSAGFLTFFDFGIFALLDLFQRVYIYFLNIIAWNAVISRSIDLIVHWTGIERCRHWSKAPCYFYFIYFSRQLYLISLTYYSSPVYFHLLIFIFNPIFIYSN